MVTSQCIHRTILALYENRIYNHIIPKIGKIFLNNRQQPDLQQFYARLKKGGRRRWVEHFGEGLSDRMVRSCHTTCQTALEKAVTEGLITTNPAIGCRLPPKKAKEIPSPFCHYTHTFTCFSNSALL